MKRLILSAALSIAAFSFAIAQNNVPQPVKSAFQQAKPGINPNYVREGSVWKGGFTENGKQKFLAFSEDGTLLYTETMLTKAQAPAAAVQDADARFTNSANYTFEGVSMVENPDGTILYQFQYGMGNGHLEVFYDENGTLVKRNLFQ